MTRWIMGILGIGNVVLGVLLYIAYGNLNRCRTDRGILKDQNTGMVVQRNRLDALLKEQTAENVRMVGLHNSEILAIAEAGRAAALANAGAIKASQEQSAYWRARQNMASPIPRSDVCSLRLDNIAKAIQDYGLEVRGAN